MLVKGEHGRRCPRGGPPVCEEHALEHEHIERRVGSVVGGEAEHMDATLQSWTCFIAGVVEAGLLQGISLSSKERFQFESPVILNPHTSACDVRAVAATSSSCHVFDGPHAAAPQHGACHTAFRSILAHIDIKLLPFLHQHYVAAGQWPCVACRSGGLQTSSRVF